MTFWQTRAPTPQEQADRLILWIGDNQSSPDALAETNIHVLAAWLGTSVARDGNPSEVGFLWLETEIYEKASQERKLYDRTIRGDYRGMKLTMPGWERYSQLKTRRGESRAAFMAMQFNQPELVRIVKDCFRPAVARTGFELRLLTDKQPAGLIDNQLRAAILASRFVISDLTHGNAGAYWEAGYGEGLGLPVIYTCQRSAWDKQKTHFDTNHMKTIIWDLGDLNAAADELAATIRATFRADAKQTDD
jgi:hypothetical protein